MANSEIFQLELLSTADYDTIGVSNKGIHELSYTIFAGSAVCIRLKIQKTAYRLLKQPQTQSLSSIILIQKHESLPTNKILAPYNIIQKYGKKVTINRLNLGIQNINNTLVPQLPSASQLYVYIHTNSIFYQIVKEIVNNQIFVVSTKLQEIYISVSWFKNRKKDKELWKNFGNQSFVQCRRLIAENEDQKFTNYLRLTIKGVAETQASQKYNCCLFIPNKSKLVFQKSQFYDLNETTKLIKLPKIYEKVYTLPPYIKLGKWLVQQVQQKPQKKILLLKSMQGVGISSYIHSFAQQHQYHFVKINCNYFISSNELLQKIKNSQSYSSTILYIKNIQWLLQVGNDKNDQQQKMKRLICSLQQTFFHLGDHSLSSHVLIISYKGNSIKFDMTKNANLSLFQMNKEDRIESFQKVLNYCKDNQEIQVGNTEEVMGLASSSLGWVPFLKVLRRIKSKLQKNQKIKTQAILKQIGKIVNMQKVENIKSVTWDDVGGLQNAKEQIIQTILLPTKHPQIFDQWIKPRTGLLFFGPPGTGKTLLGKCIANQCKMGFISVKGPELLNMYIGQSQKNVRQVFQRAAASRPCIVFMDQLDALIPKRGQSSDSNQVMDRIVSQLLTQMDKAPSRGIFVIGATNRPDLLDPSILRPGRFDKQIYLGITKQKSARMQILKAQTRHIKLSQNFDYEKVIDQVPQNFTGADFYGLTSRAITLAAEKFIEQYDKKQKTEQDDVIVTEEDFIETAKNMKPSVSLQQLARYQKLKEQYK